MQATNDSSNLFADDVEDRTGASDSPVQDHYDAAKRALDELFTQTFQYRSSKAFCDLLKFISRFRLYSPYNAMLIHVQMPGAKYATSPSRWRRDYGRTIKRGARPLLILQPMGPVMFVFDVSDTEGKALPPEIESPFEVRGGKIGSEIDRVSENARRDGVLIQGRRLGAQQAGSIRRSDGLKLVSYKNQSLPLRYELELNDDLSREARFVTLAHELAHLYCGHLGTPDNSWWPSRRGLDRTVEEFEAESVAYLVCSRVGIDNPSEQYLAGYIGRNVEVPPISLECVMKATGLIESMYRQSLKPRKPGSR